MVSAMKLTADPELCISAGNCVRLAPEVFDQGDKDGLVVILVDGVGPDQEAAVRRAIEACPTGAIAIVEET
jgi:ferredoxin